MGKRNYHNAAIATCVNATLKHSYCNMGKSQLLKRNYCNMCKRNISIEN